MNFLFFKRHIHWSYGWDSVSKANSFTTRLYFVRTSITLLQENQAAWRPASSRTNTKPFKRLCFPGSASRTCSTTPTAATSITLFPTTSSAHSPVMDRTPGAGEVMPCHFLKFSLEVIKYEKQTNRPVLKWVCKCFILPAIIKEPVLFSSDLDDFLAVYVPKRVWTEL